MNKPTTVLSALLLVALPSCVSKDYSVGLDREVSVGSLMLQKTEFVYGQGNFFDSLVYKGKEGSTIFISHHHGLNGLLSEEYRFDMNHSDVIQIGSLRLRIKSFTPETIRFVVLETTGPARIDHNDPTAYQPGDAVELARALNQE